MQDNTHFVGIGGIGMSGIARVMLEMGKSVSGSDLEMNTVTKQLEKLGGRIYLGHKASNLPALTRTVVYSSSISADNPEMKEAKKKKLDIIHRAEALASIFNARKGIAVTGTHGKTTTTSLISVMLERAGYDPTVVIGGEVDALKGNARLGCGEYAVAEADESDSSFLRLKPFYTVVTNVESEHLDHFKNIAGVRRAFRKFVANTSGSGALFYNYGDPVLKPIAESSGVRRLSFGFSNRSDIHPEEIRMDGFKTSFICVRGSQRLGTVDLNIPGRHNVLNALAAILVGLEMGLKFDAIAAAIKDFRGAKRRFQLRADSMGVMLIEDYAHHPTEIRAVLEACRNWSGRRVIAVFQPHRFTRTKFFAGEFGKCFEKADKLILTDIYAASEKAIKGVTIKCVYDKVRSGVLKDVDVIKKDRIAAHLMKIKRPNDMIVIMGAGDIKKVADELCGLMADEERRSGEFVKNFKRSVRGVVKYDEPLSSRTSIRIGGPAAVWFEPAGLSDLKKGQRLARDAGIGFFLIGNGSNLLASDDGFKGIVAHLGAPYFSRIAFKGSVVRLGAGFSLPRLVALTCGKGYSGLESLVGIPGTVGGAIFMNAGGWTNPIFRNIGELVESLKVLCPDGKVRTLARKDINFGYRSSGLDGYIILEAVLRFKKGDREALISSAAHFIKMKKDKQALEHPSAGCVFKNPSGMQFTCGQMIDMLGLKGRRVGGAEISAKHANFIVNRGRATCKDVLTLAGIVKDRVKENYGIDLDMEVKLI